MLRYIALASLAGLLLPLQSIIAARLAGAMNGPIMAALVNFAGGTAACVVLILLFRVPWPSGLQAASVPSYAWLIGVFGAFFVAQAAFTIPKLGAAGMIALVVSGQMIGSVVMDHFGILQPVQPVTPQKLLGAALLMGGVFLILRPGQ
jgi:bacterial/archaeal transporter family-2 protein